MITIIIKYEPKGTTKIIRNADNICKVTYFGSRIKVEETNNWNRNPGSSSKGDTKTTLIDIEGDDFFTSIGDIAPSSLVGKTFGKYRAKGEYNFTKFLPLRNKEHNIFVKVKELSSYSEGLKYKDVEYEMELTHLIKIIK